MSTCKISGHDSYSDPASAREPFFLVFFFQLILKHVVVIVWQTINAILSEKSLCRAHL